MEGTYHYNLIEQCVRTYRDWTSEFATAAVAEYFRFMELKAQNDDVSPSFTVDQVWHSHLLDTRSYAAYCGDHFIHHSPFVGDEFARAVRYNRAYILLGPGDMWPEPDKVIELSGPMESCVMPFCSKPKLLDRIAQKYKIDTNILRINLKGALEPFRRITWSTSVRARRGKKRTRSETRTKQILVKQSTDGKVTTCDVPESGCDIFYLKTIVQEKLGIPHLDQRLIYAGRHYEDDQSIDHVRPGSTFHLVCRLRGC